MIEVRTLVLIDREEAPCFAMFYRFLQHSFWLQPALFRTTRSRAVVAGTEAVEASTAAPPEWEAFTEVEPFMPVA